MQSLSSGMLQELQRKGAGQDEEGNIGLRGATGRGGGVPPRPSPSAETSFPFPSSYFPPTTSTRPSPFIHETVPASREPSPAGSRRRSGAQHGEVEPTLLGSRTGPGASQSSSRAPTFEAVPPQLLGRSSWADADFLIPTPDSVKQYRTEQKATATAQLRNFLSPSPASSFRCSSPVPPVTDPSPLRTESPLKTPGSVSSEASEADTISSLNTQASNASTLAYELRRSRPDLRLLHKRSRPSQHTIQKASILKLPGDIKRSPSFFRPKVIADTAVIHPATITISEVPPPTAALTLALPEIPRQDSFIKQPLQRTQTLALPPSSQRRSQLELQPAEMKVWRDLRRPLLSRATAPRNLLPIVSSPSFPRQVEIPPRQQLRFVNPPVSEPRANSTPRPPETPATQSSRKSSVSAGQIQDRARVKRHYHSVTPPEDEPKSITPLNHGDSYFQTFPVETVPSRDFVPLRTPQPIPERRNQGNGKLRLELEPQILSTPIEMVVPVLHVDSPGADSIARVETPRAAPDRRKPSSIFAFFRKTAFNDKVFDEDQAAARKPGIVKDVPKAEPTTPVATATTPGITLSAFDDGISKRRLSSVVPEMQAQSYFSRPRVRRQQSDSTLSPMGLATPVHSGSEETSTPSPYRTRPRNNRSSSEHLSPTATPLGRPRARHRPTQESLRTEFKAVNTLPRSDTSEALPVSTNREQDTAAPNGLRRGSLRFAHPLKMVRTDSDARKRRLVAIRDRSSVVLSSLLADLRKASSAEQLLQKMHAVEQNPERRRSLTTKLSITLPKISLESARASIAGGRKLQRKSSRLSQQMRSTDSGEPHPRGKSPPRGGMQPTNVPPDRRFSTNDLKVTHFEQTPFSQRYHDSKRALQQQIRAFVDQSLNEAADDNEIDDDDELVFGFEHNVPDHLPSSPLCPLHPKHKSGGKAICPLHGRYKKRKPPIAALPTGRPPMSRSVSSTTAFSGHHRMEIVFDTREEANRSRALSVAAGLERTSGDLRSRALSMAAALERSTAEDVKARTASMGSDGAGPSPAASAELRKGAPAATAVVVEWVDLGRGRTREKDACGSDRTMRRRRRRGGRMRRSG